MPAFESTVQPLPQIEFGGEADSSAAAAVLRASLEPLRTGEWPAIVLHGVGTDYSEALSKAGIQEGRVPKSAVEFSGPTAVNSYDVVRVGLLHVARGRVDAHFLEWQEGSGSYLTPMNEGDAAVFRYAGPGEFKPEFRRHIDLSRQQSPPSLFWGAAVIQNNALVTSSSLSSSSSN